MIWRVSRKNWRRFLFETMCFFAGHRSSTSDRALESSSLERPKTSVLHLLSATNYCISANNGDALFPTGYWSQTATSRAKYVSLRFRAGCMILHLSVVCCENSARSLTKSFVLFASLKCSVVSSRHTQWFHGVVLPCGRCGGAISLPKLTIPALLCKYFCCRRKEPLPVEIQLGSNAVKLTHEGWKLGGCPFFLR